ncbi:hypothetical protein ACXYL9_10325 [Qipengyuania sp. CAU 1752]
MTASSERAQPPTAFLTMGEFCNRYRLGKTSAYREAAAGRLKLRKFGSATRIAIEDAEAWASSLPIVEGGQDEAA